MKSVPPLSLLTALFAVILGAQFRSAAAPPDFAWDLAVLDAVAQRVPAAEAAPLGCMELRGWQVRAFRDALRVLAAEREGRTPPPFVLQDPVVLWPNGEVFYSFDASVSAAQRRIFLAAAADLAAFADVTFTERTAEPDYILVKNIPGLGGGNAAVGVVGPAQAFNIGEGSWNRGTLLHEMGHTLGLVHEHQRPDRDDFVTIQTANILPGLESNFVVLPGAITGAYDFLSVMHYRRDSFSIGAGQDTIVPKPGYESFADLIGNQYDRPLSTLDRVGLAAAYGAGPAPSTVVTNTRDGGPGSLTAALYRAVDAPGSTISFAIPTSDPGYDAGSGTWTIRPTDQLPKLGRLTTLDATTQPGGASTGPKIVLDGLFTAQSVDVYAHGLKLTEDGCTVRGLAIRDFDGEGVHLIGATATDNVVTRCRLGCNAAGDTAATTGFAGVAIYSGARRNRIGGPAAADRNIISGSRDLGVRLSGADVRENLVQGNFIGLRPDGVTALGNLTNGLQIDTGASANVVRGNVISGNGNYGAVLLGAGVTANRLEGNFLGTDSTGTVAAPNLWSGLGIFNGAAGNVIGGSAALRNVISGNSNNGVVLSGAGVTGNVVAGNFIGTDLTGVSALANQWSGLQLGGGASGNTIGGSAPGQGNVVAGNLNYGIVLFDSGTNANVVAGNFVGLNVTGSTALGNGWTGVGLFSGASGNLIGGGPGARNLISGNTHNGVALGGAGTSGNLLHGNSIGYDLTGQILRGNGWDGVSLYGGATDNEIGGLAPGTGNRIGGNGIRGVVLFEAGTVENPIRGNALADNADVGIDLFTGGNGGQPAPTLSNANIGTQLGVEVFLSHLASTTYRVEFFASPQSDASGFGEGRLFLGARDLTTDGSGSGGATVTLPVALPPGQVLSATATSPAGNTSRFSNATFIAMTDSDTDGLPDIWESTFGLNPANTADAALDLDGDGATASVEYLAGTDPRFATSRPPQIVPTKSGGDVQLSFSAATGRPFALEKSNDLQTWRLWSESLSGSGAAQLFLDPGALAAPRQFYRARYGY